MSMRFKCNSINFSQNNQIDYKKEYRKAYYVQCTSGEQKTKEENKHNFDKQLQR